MKNKNTGFYYQGPDGEAYCYASASEVPKEIRALPEVEAEYLDPNDFILFTTGLYNMGISAIQTKDKRIPIGVDDITYVRPKYTEQLLSRFLLRKRVKDYEALFGQEAYFLVKFLENGFLSVLTMSWNTEDFEDKRYLPMAFSSRCLASDFVKKHDLRDRRILLYRMPNPCILIGKQCQILLEKENYHG